MTSSKHKKKTGIKNFRTYTRTRTEMNKSRKFFAKKSYYLL